MLRRRLETMAISTYFRRSKWTAMAASVWIQCTSGSAYCFGVYSPLLKSSQSYDQSTLDSVAFFKDLGANIGVLSGLLYSSFAGGEGPIVVLAAGAIQCFAGYFLMWLSVTGALPRPPSGLMCFYIFRHHEVFRAHSIEPRTRPECSHHHEIRLIEEINPSENTQQKSGGGRDQTLHPRVENMSLFQAMGTSEFWLLFLVMSCAMGSGLATVNNITQIGNSLGYSTMETSTLVSLWSIWNFLGRFGGGYVSDYFLRERGCARPFFIALTLALMSFGHVLISSGLPGSLHLGSVVVGVCYGSQWSLMPTITSELFGIRHFGTIFNTVAIASPVGSYFLSVRVVGYIYDTETSSGMEACKGRHCFMLSFLIMAVVTTVGFFVSVALFFRTRVFYRQFMLARSSS